jgi:DNA polymerase I-like protein with 3'-5' exonuclease and polymerase domains
MESLDPKLIESFWTGYDPHADWTRWLAERAGTDWSYVAQSGSTKAFYKDKENFKDARGKIKNGFVFPTFFGAQARGIGIALDIEQDIIKDMQEELFAEFPEVKVWQDKVKDHYAEFGWVTGLSGIRRRAPCSPNQLINAPIQADEAWIVLDAMDRLSQLALPGTDLWRPANLRQALKIKSEIAWHLQPNMEIHDDFTFIWPKDLIDELAPIVIKTMISVPYEWAHVVPIEVEMSVGKNWSNQSEIGKFRSDTWAKKGYEVKAYD